MVPGQGEEPAQRCLKELLKKSTNQDDERMTGDNGRVATAERGRVEQDGAHIEARFVLHIQLTFREGEPRKAPSIIFSDNARVYTLQYIHFNTPLFNNIQQCMFDLF